MMMTSDDGCGRCWSGWQLIARTVESQVQVPMIVTASRRRAQPQPSPSTAATAEPQTSHIRTSTQQFRQHTCVSAGTSKQQYNTCHAHLPALMHVPAYKSHALHACMHDTTGTPHAAPTANSLSTTNRTSKRHRAAPAAPGPHLAWRACYAEACCRLLRLVSSAVIRPPYLFLAAGRAARFQDASLAPATTTIVAATQAHTAGTSPGLTPAAAPLHRAAPVLRSHPPAAPQRLSLCLCHPAQQTASVSS